MAFFISKELSGKVSEEDLYDKNPESDTSCLFLKIKAINSSFLLFDIEEIEFKKELVFLKVHVDQNFKHFKTLINCQLLDNIFLMQKVDGKEVIIDRYKSLDFRISKIKKINSGYNYCISIIIYK
jgi:hypothetical protein